MNPKAICQVCNIRNAGPDKKDPSKVGTATVCGQCHAEQEWNEKVDIDAELNAFDEICKSMGVFNGRHQ
jgi:cytochrome c553